MLYRSRNLNLNARDEGLDYSGFSGGGESSDGRISLSKLGSMKIYKNLYPKLCSYNNLKLAFEKAKKGKSFAPSVKNFEENLVNNLLLLKKDLETFTYKPIELVKFVIRDPKTRTIRKSNFRDRVVHHALVNILNPIYEQIFIYDSYASRINKGTLNAITRFDFFKRKICGGGDQN